MRTNDNDQQRRFDAIGPSEWKDAFGVLADYLTRKLKGRTHRGPFTKEALGCHAVEYFSKRAYDMLASGECRWPQYVSLATQLIRNAKREMQRVEQEWNEGMELSSEEARHKADSDERTQQSALDVAYRIASHSAKGNPLLLEFVSVMREEKNYKAIAHRMKIPLDEVKRLEQQLLKLLT